MRSNRVYVEEPLEPDTAVTIRGTAASHIIRVLRLEVGDPLTLFDGRGGEYEARIDGLRKDIVLASVGAHRAVDRESPLAITLAQGISRGERMDLVVQKATELGVRRIAPLMTERSVVRLDARQADAKLRHWRAITIAACEQCGRNILPQIAPPQRLDALLAPSAEPSQRLVLSPLGGLRVRELAIEGPLLVLIGPEGGLSEAEMAAAARAGFRALRLGPRILRTETAAVAALAALQQQLGDL
jgi:16S rRNA (uracil1498-N3)-methyltransferase